jgi:hypothetical protein
MAAGTIACCITWALAAVPVARAQYGADGTITFAMHNKDAHDKTTTMTQYTRGQKTRMEFPDSTGQPAGAWIIDGSTSTMTILMIPNKQYIQITPQQVKDAAATVKPTADSLAKIYGDSTHKPPHMTTGVSTTNVKVAKVGTETVAGVSCDVFHVTTTDEKGKVQEGELCSAKGVGFFMLSTAMAGASAGAYGGAARNPAMQANYAQFAEVVGDGRGIIKITSIDKGTKHVEMEATRIDRSTPPDALFEVPPGYTKFEMPSLKSMLKGGASNSATNTSTSDSAKASQIAQKVADSASSTAAGGVKNALKKHLHFP